MANVLGRLEDTECKGSKEVAGSQEPGSRAEREPGVLAEEVAHILELGNVLRHEDVGRLQLSEGDLVLPAGVLGHKVQHSVEHSLPSSVLSILVGDGWDWVSVFVSESNFGNLLPSLPVILVRETRMVHIQFRFIFGHKVIAIIEIRSMAGEPWGFA